MTDYRWLEPEEIEVANAAFRHQGWAEINPAASRVLGAFIDGALVEVLAFQLFPILGPMLKLDNTVNDPAIGRKLADMMDSFLRDNDARGWLAIADSPVVERLCERYGMKRVSSPVYMAVK